MIKRNYKLIVGIIIGAILTGTTVYAAAIISSINVGYNNESSKLVADNVQAAIDEVYDKSFNKDLITAYEYSEQDPKCINGEEKTCVKTDCYKKGKTCKQGTVIKYYVKENEYHYFYVLRDDGTTITMQQRENTIRNIPWYEESDDNTKGPTTILPQLEAATSTWTNVNILEYEPGQTTLYENAYTGCTITEDKKVTCNSNAYILSQRKARARMITVQETIDTGCRVLVESSCPQWMYNYLYPSKNYGGSYNDNTKNEQGKYCSFYWTMSARSDLKTSAFYVRVNGDINAYYTTGNGVGTITSELGARAVVEITKP